MQGPQTKELFKQSAAEIYRYSREPFMLASGKESNHYFNCKKITLLPDRLRLLSLAFRDELIPQFFKAVPEAVGGLTLGADPISYALSLAYLEKGKNVMPLVVRKEAKGHGTGKMIEGEYANLKQVLVVDDVITTGGSTLKAVRALRDVGLVVDSAISIVDREEGGKEALAAEGIALYSLFIKRDFAQFIEQ